MEEGHAAMRKMAFPGKNGAFWSKLANILHITVRIIRTEFVRTYLQKFGSFLTSALQNPRFKYGRGRYEDRCNKKKLKGAKRHFLLTGTSRQILSGKERVI